MGLLKYLNFFREFFRIYSVAQGQKRWYSSKTIWFQILTLALSTAVGLFGKDFGLTESDLVAVAGALVAMVNIGLRVTTDQAVGLPTTSGSESQTATSASVRSDGLPPFVNPHGNSRGSEVPGGDE